MILLHPADPSLASHRGLRWIHADESLVSQRSIESILGPEYRLCSSRNFNEQAYTSRDDFLRWADRALVNLRSEEWILSTLHRNPFASSLQLHYNGLLALRRHATADETVVVVSRKASLLRALRENRDLGSVTSTMRTRLALFTGEVIAHLRACASLAIRLARVSHTMAWSRLILGRDWLRRFGQADVLIDRYLHQRDLSFTGSYRDPYAPGLIEWLGKSGYTCSLLMHGYQIGFGSVAINLRAMRASPVPMAPFERFIGPGDLLVAMWQACMAALQGPPALDPLTGIRLNALVRSERMITLLHNIVGLVYRRLPSRLADHGVKPALLLDWFENQSIDRGLALGMAGLPETRLVAFRQYVLFPMCSSLYVSGDAVTRGAAPRVCLVSSRRMRDDLRRCDALTDYRVVPALRYSHLYDASPIPSEPSNVGQQLVVLLTHSTEENFGILDNVFAALRELSADPEVVLKIKPHPNLSMPALETMLRKHWLGVCASRSLLITDLRLPAALAGANLVISAGSSSAVEAVCMGVPVIIVGRGAGLTINPLVGLDPRLWVECYGSEEIAAALREGWPGLPLTREERQVVGHMMRGELFEPYTESAMSELIHALGGALPKNCLTVPHDQSATWPKP
jgi:hypothetical protein